MYISISEQSHRMNNIIYYLKRRKSQSCYCFLKTSLKATNFHGHASNLSVLLQSLCVFNYITSVRGSRIS